MVWMRIVGAIEKSIPHLKMARRETSRWERRERFIGTGAMYPRRCVDHDLGGVVSRPSMEHEGNATREDETTGAKISQGRTSRPCLA